MNKFKMFAAGEGIPSGFLIQLKDHAVEGETYWIIRDINNPDLPYDLVGWSPDNLNEIGKFMGYITFKEKMNSYD